MNNAKQNTMTRKGYEIKKGETTYYVLVSSTGIILQTNRMKKVKWFKNFEAAYAYYSCPQILDILFSIDTNLIQPTTLFN